MPSEHFPPPYKWRLVACPPHPTHPPLVYEGYALHLLPVSICYAACHWGSCFWLTRGTEIRLKLRAGPRSLGCSCTNLQESEKPVQDALWIPTPRLSKLCPWRRWLVINSAVATKFPSITSLPLPYLSGKRRAKTTHEDKGERKQPLKFYSHHL